jgi:ubiquinone/menaquinone biosynthesis C-methylase UbiE
MMKWLSWFQRGRSDGRAGHATLDRDGNAYLWSRERHKSGEVPYFLPSDSREISRLDFQHFMMRYAIQRNYIAPLQNPKGILDVGCGTGRWAHEMAALFPRTKVFGLDVTADHIKEVNTIPGNYRFVLGNVLEELPFPDATFDYVHQRFMHMALPVNKWPSVVRELVRVTRPLGWVELVESDLIMHHQGPAMKQLTEWGFTLGQMRGIDPRTCTQIGNFLFQARLSNIQTYRIDLPIGNWGGHLGNMAATDLIAYNQAIKPRIMSYFGVSLLEYDRITNMMRREWESNHSYFSLYLVCGQKL